MKESSGQRLKHFLFHKGMEQKQLAAILHRTPQYVNAVCGDRTTLGKKLATTLQKEIGVSAAWLLTGTGSMYAPGYVTDSQTAAEPHGNVEQENAPNPLPHQNYKTGKPYYNVDFTLGFDIMQNDQTQTPDYLIDFPPYNDCDLWCNAHGDSMQPTISNGDIVALKHIADPSYLINGEIYAIVTSNGLRTIKRIRDNGDTLTLIADNPSVGEQVIPKSFIIRAFLVRGSIKMF